MITKYRNIIITITDREDERNGLSFEIPLKPESQAIKA